LAGLATLLCLSTVSIADEALLVGGGYATWRSEAQIELNVSWVRDVLRQAGIPVTTWFTDGEAAGADVMTLRTADAATDPLDALSSVFGDRRQARTTYAENSLGDLAGGTQRDTLLPALQQRLDENGEPLLLVYNGHGTQSPDSPAGVSLELWGQSALTVDELHTLAGGRTAPLRWIFTQCYSGGFHRLAFADPHSGLELAQGQRCGFTSESAYRLAEGCSASIELGDYRDYTTFFFAALSGRERDGRIVDSDPDTDADGVTTPREAHLYTLRHAYSSDLSRSTSEDWLDAWQPWYLRWLPPPRHVPTNEYAELYRDIASRLDIVLDENTPIRLREQLARYRDDVQALHEERVALRERERGLRERIRAELLPRWPALLGPYTAAYASLARNGDLERIAADISAMPTFDELQRTQAEDDALDARFVDSERAAVQRLKLLRMRRLALLKDQLARHGDAQDRDRYERLVSCEAQPLTPPGAIDPVPR